MIPKIIHYCWLSDDPFPANIQECIDSWKRVLPEYEIVKWDRKRFDIDSVPYVKEAYDAKKYAFCADYIRIYALYHYGGIYLDSDVMVYKPFDSFLNLHSFSSVEFHSYFLYARISNKKERLVGIEAAVLGSEKGATWLKDVLDYYEGRHFSLASNELKKNIMPRVIARVLHSKYGFQYTPTFQRLTNGMEVYPTEVFSSRIADGCPIKYSTHLGANSWGFGGNAHRNNLRNVLLKLHLLGFVRKLRGISDH
jgi:hypothetical protein